MKNKLMMASALGVSAAALAIASLAAAQTTVSPLGVTCSATVSNNTIAWTASASNGVAPYTYLWSGDASVAGSTSTSITATYQTNGTYSASVQATDSSSSVATANCSGVVSYFVSSAPTSTPPAEPSSTAMHTVVNLPPELQIGPNGGYLAHDLIVQSISGNSFTGTVWGITYTVNTGSSTGSGIGGIGTGASGGVIPEFYLRAGNSGGSFNIAELQVGDQLGVSGWVSSSSPLVVNANVIRDYSITVARPITHGTFGQGGFDSESFDTGSFGQGGQNGGKTGNGGGNGNNNGGGNGGNAGGPGPSNTTSGNDAQARLDQLLQQLQNLQNLFKGQSGNK